jgi:hypothetical protein
LNSQREAARVAGVLDAVLVSGGVVVVLNLAWLFSFRLWFV